MMRGFDDLTEEQQKGLLAQIEAVGLGKPSNWRENSQKFLWENCPL